MKIFEFLKNKKNFGGKELSIHVNLALGELFLRFRREGGFPASERRQGGRGGPGEAAGGGDASMAPWSGGNRRRRHS